MKIINNDDTAWAEIALNLADVYRKQERFADARELYLKCLKKLESIHGENHPQVLYLSTTNNRIVSY